MIVVDTNILAYRWLDNPRSLAAEKLVQLDPEWAAPLLWRSEFRNVLAGYLRAKRLNSDQAQAAAGKAAAGLLGGEHTVSDRAVLELVARSRCTAYDCEFVALALALGTLLVTDDRAVLQAFPKQCRSLDETISQGVKF